MDTHTDCCIAQCCLHAAPAASSRSSQDCTIRQCFLAGLTTGLVVDSGATQTSVIPVLDGWTNVARIRRVPVAGDTVTRRLQLLVQHKIGMARSNGPRSNSNPADVGPNAGASGLSEAVFARMKERCCYVAVNPEDEVRVRCTSLAIVLHGLADILWLAHVAVNFEDEVWVHLSAQAYCWHYVASFSVASCYMAMHGGEPLTTGMSAQRI